MTDPYADADGVLYNNLGIDDYDELERAVDDITFARTRELADWPIGGDFDLEHLNEIHRELYDGVFDWAGVPRKDFTSVKMGERAAVFCAWEAIPDRASIVFADLADDNHLRGLPRAEFAERLSYHWNEINMVHPYRDGNGRATRSFLTELAAEAGYKIDLHFDSATTNRIAAAADADRDRQPMIEAIDGAITAEPTATRIRADAVEPADRLAALDRRLDRLRTPDRGPIAAAQARVETVEQAIVDADDLYDAARHKFDKTEALADISAADSAKKAAARARRDLTKAQHDVTTATILDDENQRAWKRSGKTERQRLETKRAALADKPGLIAGALVDKSKPPNGWSNRSMPSKRRSTSTSSTRARRRRRDTGGPDKPRGQRR